MFEEGEPVWECSQCGTQSNEEFEFCVEDNLIFKGRWRVCHLCHGAGCDDLEDCEECDGNGGWVVPGAEPCVWCGSLPKCESGKCSVEAEERRRRDAVPIN